MDFGILNTSISPIRVPDSFKVDSKKQYLGIFEFKNKNFRIITKVKTD